MTLRELFDNHGVDVEALLDEPIGGSSLGYRREQGQPQAEVSAQWSDGALLLAISVPLYKGKARSALERFGGKQ